MIGITLLAHHLIVIPEEKREAAERAEVFKRDVSESKAKFEHMMLQHSQQLLSVIHSVLEDNPEMSKLYKK